MLRGLTNKDSGFATDQETIVDGNLPLSKKTKEEVSGFRDLSVAEIVCVSGGESIPSGPTDAEIQLRMSLQSLSRIQRSDVLSALVAGGAFGDPMGMFGGEGDSSVGENSQNGGSADGDSMLEIVVEGLSILSSNDTLVQKYNETIMKEKLQDFIESWRNHYASFGWSFYAAGGATFYSDGVGVFIGVAMPGPVISGGSTAEGSQTNYWDYGVGSALYQTGPLPFVVGDRVFFDPLRNDYYHEGQIWSETENDYVYPEEGTDINLIEDGSSELPPG